MLPWLIVVALQLVSATTKEPTRDYDSRDYFIVELDTSLLLLPLVAFKQQHPEYALENQLWDDHYVFSVDKNSHKRELFGNVNADGVQMLADYPQAQHFQNYPWLKLVELIEELKIQRRLPVDIDYATLFDSRDVKIWDLLQQRIKEVAEKFNISDPTFVEQWHLVNTQYPGNDVNVTGAWDIGVTGKNITVAVVDDGVDGEAEDLKDNFNLEALWDFNDPGNTPWPRLQDDYHGTRCAGEIAAVKNDVCGVGVAYEGKVSGIRILSRVLPSDKEALAMKHAMDLNDIYSCSWGPTDDGKTVAAPANIVRKAMVETVQNGRNGKGLVFVFASGNGALRGDSCNFDGYTNSIFSITVGAIDYQGRHPYYSEACTAVMCVTYSLGGLEHIHTTDLKGKCTNHHGGTSAAAPLAAGIFALALSANPELTWRDMQHCVLHAAVTVNEDDGDYQMTKLGKKFSSKYGFGKVDAYQLVETAKAWKNVKPWTWMYADKIEVNQQIVQKGKGTTGEASPAGDIIRLKTTISEDDLKVMNFAKVEHVTVVLTIHSTRRGATGVRLVSPLGVKSLLATFRNSDHNVSGFTRWTFMLVAHWGEDGLGDWTLEVFADDSSLNDVTIELVDWQLRLWGESDDADKAEKYNYDTDYAEVRRKRLEGFNDHDAPQETNHDTPHTTDKPNVDVPVATSMADDTTDKQESGGDSKPTDIPEKSAEKSAEPEKTDDSQNTDTPESTEHEEDPEETDEPENDDGTGKGANKPLTVDHTGVYFIALAVVGFIVVIAFMKFSKLPMRSRKRRRRDEYEFDVVPGEDYTDLDDGELDELVNMYRHSSRDLRRDEQRLYDELNADVLPESAEEMFAIGDEDELPPPVPPKDNIVKPKKTDVDEDVEDDTSESHKLLPSDR